MILETIKGKLGTQPEENKQDTDAIIPVSEYREVICQVAESVTLGGYDPISQIVGFLLSEDPTHIANYGNARGLISKIDRDALLNDMVACYLKNADNENN